MLDCGITAIRAGLLVIQKRGSKLSLVGGNPITNDPHISGTGMFTAGDDLPAVRELSRQISFER